MGYCILRKICVCVAKKAIPINNIELKDTFLM